VTDFHALHKEQYVVVFNTFSAMPTVV